MVEPVFADTKFNRRIDRFLRRGRAAARSEWRLTNAAHNLLKLWPHTTAPSDGLSEGALSRERSGGSSRAAAAPPPAETPAHGPFRNSLHGKQQPVVVSPPGVGRAGVELTRVSETA